MAAISAIRFEPESKAFDERLRSRGEPHKVVLVAVMRKLVSVLTALLREESPPAARRPLTPLAATDAVRSRTATLPECSFAGTRRTGSQRLADLSPRRHQVVKRSHQAKPAHRSHLDAHLDQARLLPIRYSVPVDAAGARWNQLVSTIGTPTPLAAIREGVRRIGSAKATIPALGGYLRCRIDCEAGDNAGRGPPPLRPHRTRAVSLESPDDVDR